MIRSTSFARRRTIGAACPTAARSPLIELGTVCAALRGQRQELQAAKLQLAYSTALEPILEAHTAVHRRQPRAASCWWSEEEMMLYGASRIHHGCSFQLYGNSLRHAMSC